MVLLLYYTVPARIQWLILLGASLCFYLSNGFGNLGFILLTTITTYFVSIRICCNRDLSGEKNAKQKNRFWIWIYAAVNIGLLAVCKVRFTFHNILLPLGISFYLFQSLGYVLDVYRGTARAERNPFKLALFVSYFPQLVQGPISRFSQLSPQLFSVHPYDRKKVSFGMQRMLWGYFKKLVIADRIAIAVAALKAPEHTGVSFLVLAAFYAVQIYGDFTGGIDIAIGLSEAFGIDLRENFVRPFLSKNTAEYWRRWHITLGEWMKDYIFYPVSVSAPLRRFSKIARKKWGKAGKRIPVYAASLATWFCTGIWHGLTPNFLLWGMVNCFIIVLSGELAPLYAKFHNRYHLKERAWYSAFEIIRTFLLMNLIRVIDLFPHVGEYFRRLGTIHTSFRVPFMDLGLSVADYCILLMGTLLLACVSMLQEKKGSVRELLWNQNTAVRYGVFFCLFLMVLLLGNYGIGYDPSNFIYNQF